MSKHRLGIDLDGVICEFNKAYARLLAEENGVDLLPSGWEGNPEVFHTWNWDAEFGYGPAVMDRVWQEHIIRSSKFWEKLPVLPEAYGVIRQLDWLSKNDVDVYFLTNRMGKNAKLQTEKFLYNEGMAYPTVILASNKVPIIRSLDLTFFVDDKLETMQELVSVANRDRWLSDKHFFLKDAPWNRAGRRGLEVVGSVKEALELVGLWQELGTKTKSS